MTPADRLTCAHAGIAALRRQAAALELQRTAARIMARKEPYTLTAEEQTAAAKRLMEERKP